MVKLYLFTIVLYVAGKLRYDDGMHTSSVIDIRRLSVDPNIKFFYCGEGRDR